MTDDKKYDYFIYKLYNPDCDYVYVGSTRNMTQRKKNHKYDCNNVNGEKYNYKVYKTIREHHGWDEWFMIVLEIMDNVTKLEAEMKEDLYRVDLNASMNSKRASCGGITSQQYNTQYYQNNIEQLLEKANQKHDCECGGKYTHAHKKRHMKSKKHQKYISTLNNL